MKKNIFILPLFLLATCCKAQKTIQAQDEAQFITSASFIQYNGGVMVIKALLNNIPDTMNFILDTGSGGLSLDSATCKKYHIQAIPSDTTITGMAGSHKASFAFNQQLHLPGLTVDSLNFHINDYDLLTSVYGEKIDGIIGYGFFSRYIVKIDFDNSLMEVYTPGKIKYPGGGTLLHPVFTTIPIETLQVKDARKLSYDFFFDTGAGICFLMNDQFVKDSNVLAPHKKIFSTIAEGMGGQVQMNLTVVKEIKIGGYKFNSVPTYIFKDVYNVTSYPFVAGLIGNDLLRRFNIIFNYPEHEIYLSPNSHLYDAFDYTYTGLTMYFENGKIIIDDVMDGSPADKAGLKRGDVLVAVENNISNNIQQYKTLLQSSGKKVNMIISRNNELITLKIKPISIL